MKRLIIEQEDVWTFGDGRPFEAGEDHYQACVFPPTAMTLQGALRARRLADSGVPFRQFKKENPACASLGDEIGWPGERDSYGHLRLRGPWLSKDGQRYYPVPADVVKIGDECRVLGPASNLPFVNNDPANLRTLWLKTLDRFKEALGWLSEAEMQHYLNQGSFQATEAQSLFTKESRFNVKIESQRKRPQEGMLYSLEYVRLNDGVSLQAEVEGLSLAPQGWLAFGGDSRVAHYRLEEDSPTPKPVTLTGQFKIVFITPAYFEQGWQSADWKRWFPGARLIAAAVKRPQLIGGRDVAQNQPKSLTRFVAAGSVYFFETDQTLTYDHQSITDFGAAIGFGQILTGAWNYVRS